MLHPETPDDAKTDAHLYAAWRYETLGAEEAAALRGRNLSIAAQLALFRQEWSDAQEGGT